MRNLIGILFLCFCDNGFSQETAQKNSLFTIRGNVGIPKVVSSKMFRTSFAGIYETNLSLIVRLFDNFYLGTGYQNTQFENNKFLKQQVFNASISYNTRLFANGFFLRLGYDKFFLNKKGYFGYAINTGHMLCTYKNINGDTSHYNQPLPSDQIRAFYIQPEISANFIVEPRLSFALMLSYTSMFSRFDARAPRFNQFEEIRKASNKYLMAWLNFGIGFHVLINKK